MSLTKFIFETLEIGSMNVSFPVFIISGILVAGITVYSLNQIPTIEGEGLTKEERSKANEDEIDKWWNQQSNSFKLFVKYTGITFAISTLSVLVLPVLQEIAVG